MKAHTCNTKRSQKTFEPRANKPNLSHTSRNVTHTQYEPLTHKSKHGRMGRKKLGGRKKICPTFSDCARVFRRNFPKLLSTGGRRSDYEKFLLDSIFPTKLTEFPTKLTEFVTLIFIISQYCPTVKRILPDWLCLPNKLGGGGCRPLRPPPGTPMSRNVTHKQVELSSWGHRIKIHIEGPLTSEALKFLSSRMSHYACWPPFS